jgi:ferrochelatase
MRYRGQTRFDHQSRDLDAVVLVNLGTPDAPEPGPVRRYLAEFLSDPRVIELPRLLWWLVLHGVILRIRPRRSARAYREVWTGAGSPLLVHTADLAAKVGRVLDPTGERPLAVVHAMRYGRPGLPEVLRGLADRNLRRLVILPLYPQYSATTTASVFDAVAAELRTWRRVPALRFVSDYWREPAWIDAVAETVRAHVADKGLPDRLLFSFHGIPERYFRNGDHYHCQCHGSAARIAERAAIPRDRWQVAFQSRVGREPWLRPYTDETLAAWPKAGVRRVAVVCPGFAVDCLETLEEIAIQNREAFLAAGGERYDYVPALNAGDAHVALLADLARRELAGWPSVDPAWSGDAEQRMLAARAAHARALGAESTP